MNRTEVKALEGLRIAADKAVEDYLDAAVEAEAARLAALSRWEDAKAAHRAYKDARREAYGRT